MKRLLLAAVLVLPLSARAEERDAYGSLLAMGASAKTDRGPDAGELALPANGERDRKPEEKGAAPDDAQDLNPEAAPAPSRPAPAVSTAAAPAPSKEEAGRPAVLARPGATPRVWTSLFASLLPPLRPASGVPAFEVALSTTALRPRPLVVHAVTPASQAGAAQGLLEVVAMATAPSDPR